LLSSKTVDQEHITQSNFAKTVDSMSSPTRVERTTGLTTGVNVRTSNPKVTRGLIAITAGAGVGTESR